MKNRTLITDLENPLREVRDALVEITKKLAVTRRVAAQLRAVDHITDPSLRTPESRTPELLHEISTSQLAIDELSESLSHACARLTEARAHIAVGNRAMAEVVKLLPKHEAKDAS